MFDSFVTTSDHETSNKHTRKEKKNGKKAEDASTVYMDQTVAVQNKSEAKQTTEK